MRRLLARPLEGAVALEDLRKRRDVPRAVSRNGEAEGPDEPTVTLRKAVHGKEGHKTAQYRRRTARMRGNAAPFYGGVVPL